MFNQLVDLTCHFIIDISIFTVLNYLLNGTYLLFSIIITIHSLHQSNPLVSFDDEIRPVLVTCCVLDSENDLVNPLTFLILSFFRHLCFKIWAFITKIFPHIFSNVVSFLPFLRTLLINYTYELFSENFFSHDFLYSFQKGQNVFKDEELIFALLYDVYKIHPLLCSITWIPKPAIYHVTKYGYFSAQ